MKAAPWGPDSRRHVKFAARILPTLIGAMFLVAGFSAHAANLTVDGAQRFQTIDGMGVNINVNSWNNGQLKPALDFLIATNGSTLFRVVRDPMDWVASESLIPDLHALTPNALQQVYETAKMQDIWNTIGYLNKKGIGGRQIILNFMGWTPRWIGGSGTFGAPSYITAGKEQAFATMVASLVYYGKKVKGLDFTYLSPLNDIDLSGSCTESPCVGTAQYTTIMHEIADELNQMGVTDMRFVGPDTAYIGSSVGCIAQMMADSTVAGLTDHFALHDFSGAPASPGTSYPGKNYWLTATSAGCSGCDGVGSGPPNEWSFATQTADVILGDINNGFPAVLVWEAYDSFWYHHNASTLWGLLAYNPVTGIYTPRKRAYAYTQFNRFIGPGDVVIGSGESTGSVPTTVAVFNATNGKIAIIGRNSGNSAITINGQLSNLPAVNTLALYETNLSADLSRKGDVPVSGGIFTAQISADAIFTLTNQPITFDLEPPTVAVNSPLNGAQVSGTFEAGASAFDVAGNVSAQSSAVSASTTTYAFDDEFNAGALDTTQWVAMNRPGDSSNNEQQYYLPTNVALSNGLLNITSKADNWVPGYSYTSGMVQWKSFNFTYGTIEFRAKLAGGQGTWPAIWLLGHNCQASNVTSADNIGSCNWPAPGSDEIDITEIKGGVLSTVWQNVISGSSGFQSCTPSTTDVSQNWHIYDLIWAPGSLTWQIDGVTTCHITRSVPSTPMFLIVNTAMGGAGGAIKAGTLPQTSSLDYVRVTSYDTTAPTIPTGLSATAVSSSQIILSWSASTDNIGVAGYKVYRGGSQIATVTGTTYNDTGLSPSTTYTYTVSAYDAAGNVSGQSSPTSATTTALLDTTPPDVSITSPLSNATVSGLITVSVSATDNTGVARVEFYLDNVLQVTDTATPFNWSWNTAQTSNGSHNLTAKAYDAAGNIGTSPGVVVTVANPVSGIALVQKASNITSSAQNLSAKLPLPVTADNFIVVSVSGWPNLPAATPVTDTLGNTYSIAGTVLVSQGAYSAIYYAKNVKGGTDTVTVNTVNSGGQISMVIAEFGGVNTVSPLDGTAGTVGSGTVPSSGTMTPSLAGDLVIGSGTHNGNTVTTAGTGFSMLAIPTEDSNSHQPLAMEYQILSGNAQTSSTFSLANAYPWAQNGALFKHQ